MMLRVLLLLSLLSVSGLSASTENLAAGAKAVQSSTYSHVGGAQKAVDGDNNPDYMQSSCTHTDFEVNPWWRVELPAIYNVTSVTITNRGDCCGDRINGAQIRIGNSLKNNGNDNKLVAVIRAILTGHTRSYSFHDAVGRYVNIFLPGEPKALTLCEVQVFGDVIDEQKASLLPEKAGLRNVALKGRATQSSLNGSGMWAGFGIAGNAIDGNRNSNLMMGSCTETAQESAPWWRVNLHRKYTMSTVALTNRGDCCPEGLDGAEIRIGNSIENEGKDNPLCATVSSIPAGQTEHFNCSTLLEGSYVTVFLPREGTLSLCEVEVFADELRPLSVLPPENIAAGAKAVQSSTQEHLGDAQNAVDGNNNTDYRRGSCTHTKYEADPWWRVELPGVCNVTSVTITNRGDCCGHRINGAQIRIGNSLKNNGNDNKLVAVIGPLGSDVTKAYRFRATEGQYVNIFLPGENKILTLCEVKVFADEEFSPESFHLHDQTELHNLALRGTATQSSLHSSSTLAAFGLAQNAIDGNRNSHLKKGSCMQTGNESAPWWRVNLHHKSMIFSVALTNRGDCCSEHLDGAEIRIGDSVKNNGKDNPLCATVSSIPAGQTEYFNCSALLEGSYVTVSLPREGTLSLCEVEVFGVPVVRCGD
ncbi:uncharacterized protein LOC118820967 [Colossoma macropomum]|uniref:uncharacterized protein LOC118820967 n=1 Tax=Colossoma macropomum TaxID=42526 RepID=UPI0018640443|nr:uncharacterized protein LOC118820967 [Colossoma macropomum]XP_036445223.1 uncharacterized protein LOC118820967 [Colossoma macropomum]